MLRKNCTGCVCEGERERERERERDSYITGILIQRFFFNIRQTCKLEKIINFLCNSKLKNPTLARNDKRKSRDRRFMYQIRWN